MQGLIARLSAHAGAHPVGRAPLGADTDEVLAELDPRPSATGHVTGPTPTTRPVSPPRRSHVGAGLPGAGAPG